MLQILLHSSKTMRVPARSPAPLSQPQFLASAQELVGQWRGAGADKYIALMKLSPQKAAEAAALYQQWTADPKRQIPAVDAFVGDIYSGLQVSAWSTYDRQYAHKHLLILSGLYGALRACDGIRPYRLEMGYKLPSSESLYHYWGSRLASAISPRTTFIVNLSAIEYTKALLPYLSVPVISPKFLTVSPTTNKPAFVTVHTKIARGAFASWLIRGRITRADQLKLFSELGYRYVPDFSTPTQPVFVCQEFGGIGMSVRGT